MNKNAERVKMSLIDGRFQPTLVYFLYIIFCIFAKTIKEGGTLMSTKKETQEIKKTAEMNKGSNGSVNSMPSIWYT